VLGARFDIRHGLNSQSPEMHPSPRLSLNAGVMGFHGAGQGIHPDLNNTGIVVNNTGIVGRV